MKVSELLRTAMAKSGVKDSKELARKSGVSYSTVYRAITDENVGITVVVELLDCMGFQLKAEAK